MKRHQLRSALEKRSLLTFFLLVVVFSLPFWVIGAVAEQFLPDELMMNLPISSLMACGPILAAVILVRRKDGPHGVKKLLKGAFDYKRIERKSWYVPILFLMPATMVVEYGLMKLVRVPLPDPQVPLLMTLIYFVVFFIEALCEEIGWLGYAIDPMQERWGALTASIILGIVWAMWHIVPFIQMNRTPTWIASQCTYMVAARILYVWIYNNTGKSVFAVIMFHAMHNVSTVLLPAYGWHYDPLVALIILAVVAGLITFLWGPKSLAHYRFARTGKAAQTGLANLAPDAEA